MSSLKALSKYYYLNIQTVPIKASFKISINSHLFNKKLMRYQPNSFTGIFWLMLINHLNTKRRLLYLTNQFVAKQLLNPLNTKRRLLYLKTQFIAQQLLNTLNTKRRLLYLKTQFVAQQLLNPFKDEAQTALFKDSVRSSVAA